MLSLPDFFLGLLFLPLTEYSTKIFQFRASLVTMRPFAYEATIFGIPYRVATISRLLAAGLAGVTPFGLWRLLLAFATVIPTIIMTAYLVVLLGTNRLLSPEVCQGFSLRNGVVYSPDLPPFQLRSNFAARP